MRTICIWTLVGTIIVAMGWAVAEGMDALFPGADSGTTPLCAPSLKGVPQVLHPECSKAGEE